MRTRYEEKWNIAAIPGLELPSPNFIVLIMFKSGYATSKQMHYFPPYNAFLTDETSRATKLYIAIFTADALTNYINWFHHY